MTVATPSLIATVAIWPLPSTASYSPRRFLKCPAGPTASRRRKPSRLEVGMGPWLSALGPSPSPAPLRSDRIRPAPLACWPKIGLVSILTSACRFTARRARPNVQPPYGTRVDNHTADLFHQSRLANSPAASGSAVVGGAALRLVPGLAGLMASALMKAPGGPWPPQLSPPAHPMSKGGAQAADSPPLEVGLFHALSATSLPQASIQPAFADRP